MSDLMPHDWPRVSLALRWFFTGVLIFLAISVLFDANIKIDQTAPVVGSFYGQF